MKLTGLIRGVISKLVTRSYDGAAGGRRWRGAGEMPLQLAAMQAARGPLAKRARYLEANNGNAAAGVSAWVSALVGTGIKPQSAHPSEAVRQRLNAAWGQWTDRADADGLADAYGLQELAARRMIIDGDCFAPMTATANGELRIRLMDAEQVDPGLHRDLGGGARIISGIEFDAGGRRAGYHAMRERPGLPLATTLDTVRLAADDVVHLFRPITPGQVRGLSWFAPCLLRAREHDEAIDAQLVRQKVSALFAGFITDANGEAGGFTGTPGASAGVIDGGLEPGTLKVLDSGKDIRFSEPANIGAEAIDFLKITAREIAAGLGVPYEAMTGDLTGVNYSSIRAGLVEFRRRAEAMQYNVLVFQLCRPMWRRFVTLEILSGRLHAPGFTREPEPYLSANWIPPKQDWVDPSKDVAAEIEAIDAGLMSRRQAVAMRGMDLEQLDREIASDRQRAGALGLSFAGPSLRTRPPSDPAEAA